MGSLLFPHSHHFLHSPTQVWKCRGNINLETNNEDSTLKSSFKNTLTKIQDQELTKTKMRYRLRTNKKARAELVSWTASSRSLIGSSWQPINRQSIPPFKWAPASTTPCLSRSISKFQSLIPRESLVFHSTRRTLWIMLSQSPSISTSNNRTQVSVTTIQSQLRRTCQLLLAYSSQLQIEVPKRTQGRSLKTSYSQLLVLTTEEMASISFMSRETKAPDNSKPLCRRRESP